ncbi:dTMP kinase [uncultured Acidaminococcus sp.]|uniref:dTMP kinase n=1 Tax=uncultured Acidaminococcus sp. TaxID=352152 RepID=UPI00260B58B8|nr:dTMP kinase [uncultured Acidaminococcus sp.]
MKKGKGLFITLEGPDGGGKTTQAQQLASWFRLYGREVLITREPGGTETAESIRELVLDPALQLSPETESLLQLAARADHVSQVIRPALDAGKVVLCDRFSDSTLVYQGILRDMDLDQLRKLNDFATRGLRPDVTLLLDGDPRELLKRRNDRGIVDKFELQGLAFQDRVRAGYLQLAQAEPERILVVDALEEPEVVTEEIIKKLEKWI